MSKDSEEKEYVPELKRRIETVSQYLFHYLTFTSMKKETVTDLSYEMHGLPEKPYYCKAIHRLVNHYCNSFNEIFQAAYELHLPAPIKNDWDYASYGVATCKRFMDQDFTFLQEELDELKLPYFFLLMSAAFLFQLENFSSEKGHITEYGCEPKCLVLVYDRYLKPSFKEAGGLEGFREYCDSIWQIYESLPNAFTGRIMGLPARGQTIAELRIKIGNAVTSFSGTNDLSKAERQYFGPCSDD